MRRAALLLVAAACALAGCAAASDGSGGGADMLEPPATGLVLALDYNHRDVVEVSLSGATYSSQRKFGPYVVSEQAMPSDNTVGFVFDESDAGRAMICGETHDVTGHVLSSGCDTFSIRSDSINHDNLTFYQPNQPTR
jgi:hypothetical protein